MAFDKTYLPYSGCQMDNNLLYTLSRFPTIFAYPQVNGLNSSAAVDFIIGNLTSAPRPDPMAFKYKQVEADETPASVTRILFARQLLR